MKQLMSSRDDKWGILELQNCILNIAEYIDRFCDENSIDYCLMGGSALGAVRHKGFIPWDDDLDIFMRPNEYQKFRKSFLEKGDRKLYYLQEWGSQKGKPTMAKLRINNSHYVEKDLEKLDIHKGVYVDIFILHACPDFKLGRLNQYLWSRYLVLKSLANRNYNRRGILAKLILQPLKWLPKKAFVDFALRQLYKNAGKETKYYCHYLGRAGYKKGIYQSDFFKQTKKVNFESIKLRVPDKVEDYLRDRWGNYMRLPSENEIRHFQHSSGWSVDSTFDGYKESGDYKDENLLIT